jgi:hypothetical protein
MKHPCIAQVKTTPLGAGCVSGQSLTPRRRVQIRRAD